MGTKNRTGEPRSPAVVFGISTSLEQASRENAVCQSPKTTRPGWPNPLETSKNDRQSVTAGFLCPSENHAGEGGPLSVSNIPGLMKS
ncbi:MAG: hypothetical protein RLZZ261_1308 [Bacteroidota bacterium]|jgi:hypothetical protein